MDMSMFRGLAVLFVGMWGVFGMTNGDRQVPNCQEAPHGVERISWGEHGLHFDVQKDEVELRMGKPDVDYVMDRIRPKGGKAVLELWFGMNAWAPDEPEEMKKMRSVRRTAIAGGWGLDTRGQTADGQYWRSAGLRGQGGAEYRNASEADAKVLDRVIDSMCWVEYPKMK